MPVVDVWTADLGVPPQEIQRLEAYLHADERARAARFRFARDKRRFVVRRGLLRERVAQVVSEPPERLVFSLGRWGKPILRDHRCPFSLSHSHERMALAISELEVGCDIERIDEGLDWAPVAAQLLEPSALKQLALVPPADARTAFFRCWTRMEARVKAAGQGLGQSIGTLAWPRREPDAAWHVSDVDGPPDYALAVAVPTQTSSSRVIIRRSEAV